MTSQQSVTQEQDIQVTLVTEWCVTVSQERCHTDTGATGDPVPLRCPGWDLSTASGPHTLQQCDHQMAPLLPPLHPTHNWWDHHHHQGRHRDTAAVRHFYPISTSSTLDSLLLVYELDIDQSWWNGSWADQRSCRAVIQSCSHAHALCLHCIAPDPDC